MSDLQKWIVSIAIGGFVGLLSCAMDTKDQNFRDYVRHSAGGMLPAVISLQMKLKDKP